MILFDICGYWLMWINIGIENLDLDNKDMVLSLKTVNFGLH